MKKEKDRSEVVELLERREAIQGWLDRLEAQKAAASGRVLDRVRTDYEGRLQKVLEALGRHGEAVRDQLREAEERLAAAEQARDEAADGLEEGDLRHRIGELADDEWDSRRLLLEGAAERAAQAEANAAADVKHLRAVLEHLEGTRPASADDEPTLETAVWAEPPEEPLDVGDAAVDEDDQDDRTVPTAERAEEEAGNGEAAPRPGLKCPDCGYTNDISAWFCGVCGADIG